MKAEITVGPPYVGIVCGDGDGDEGEQWQVAARYFGKKLAHLRLPIDSNVAVEPPSFGDPSAKPG